MKKQLIVLLAIVLAVSQSASSCQICLQVANCSSDLMSDSAIDPIYNSLIQQITYTSPPISILRNQNSNEANYTFSWSNSIYLATLDLASLSYQIIAQETAQNLQRIQNDINAIYSLPLIFNSSSNFFTVIDNDIQNQYFNGVNVTCIDFQNVTGGYHVVYQKSDGTTVAFDVSVQNRGGNSYSISYSICTNGQNINSQQFVSIQNGPNSASYSSVSSQSTVYSSSQTASSLPSPSPPQSSAAIITNDSSTNTNSIPLQFLTPVTPQMPLVGGYSLVSNPLNDSDVQNIIKLLIYQYGNVINSGILVSVERQVVNGLNYKLTISFDQSSTMQYIIIVYKTLSGEYSITSQAMVNTPTSYNFSSSYLSASQAAKLSYFSPLINLVSQQLGSIMTFDTVLDKLYQNIPYFQLVFYNAAYLQIIIIVEYDILQNTIQVINQSSILRKQSNYQQTQQSSLQPSSNNLRVNDDSDRPMTNIANCLSQSGNFCTKCASKYFLSQGKCLQIPIQCSSFNYNINHCESCNQGYYLDSSKVCQLAHYICQTSNSRGHCLSCYQNYRLSFDGRCIYNAEGADEKYPQQEDNPLCSKFNGPSCLSCVQKCYQNQKGTCKIIDPNCSTFDPDNEMCKVCRNQYILSNSSSTCVPAPYSQ